MEFKRVETQRIVAAQKTIGDEADIRKVFQIVCRDKMRFSILVKGMGRFSDCVVQSVDSNSVVILTARPSSLRLKRKFEDIISMEIESNVDFISDEDDENGRWSRI